MDLHEFYKEHYFYEAERRHKMTSALNIPIAIITALAGASMVIAQDVKVPFRFIELCQIGLLFTSVIAISLAIYYLIRSYFNYSYGYIATTEQLRQYYHKLSDYYQGTNTQSNQSAKTDFEEFVNCEYAKYAHQNALNNDQKAYFIHRANGFIIIALIVVFIASLPYVIRTIGAPSKIQKIEIVSPEKKRGETMAEENKPEVKPTEGTKPSPPPGRIVKESVDPKKITKRDK